MVSVSVYVTGSTDKSRMLDITRDKPIKVAVRVVVPVRDHPKVRFKQICFVQYMSQRFNFAQFISVQLCR